MRKGEGGEHIQKAEKNKEYIRQCEIIREFDRKQRKCASNGMEPVHMLAKGVYVVLIAMVMWIPFDMEEVSTIAVCTLGANIWPTWIFLSGYLYVNEDGKMHFTAAHYLEAFTACGIFHFQCNVLQQFSLQSFTDLAACYKLAFLACER